MRSFTILTNIFLILVLLSPTMRLSSQELKPVEPAGNAKGSLQDLPWEEVFLHVDREMYIAGEDIWLSIYTLDGESGRLSGRSTLVYVELLNPWNIPVIQSRFRLSGGRGEGNLLLPDSLSSGTYTIRAYTNWMKNFLPYNCYMQDVEVFNPFGNSDFMRKEIPLDNLNLKENVTGHKKYNSISLIADTIFGRREKVSLKIETVSNDTGFLGNYEFSISVTPEGVSKGFKRIDDFMSEMQARRDIILSRIKVPPQYSFESSGHHLSVMLKYRDKNRTDSSDYLYMSIQGKVAEFRYAGRDSTGHFDFILPVDSKIRNLVLQPDHANNNMMLQIEPSFSWLLPESHSFRDTLTELQRNVFSTLSFNYQASKIYGTTLKKELETNDNINAKKRRFYGKPEMEILLSDYISLPTMQEVFFELLPGIFIRTLKTGYDMRIINPLTDTYSAEPPLVMIDGVIINDLSVLVDVNPEIVEKIEVVKTPYHIGDLILHGIVNVITRHGNFSDITMPDYAVILPYRVIDKMFRITAPDYSVEETRLNRIPDLRNTLYWNPSVKKNINGEYAAEFWTSDLPGIYNIKIQGISQSGAKVTLYKSFRVL